MAEDKAVSLMKKVELNEKVNVQMTDNKLKKNC